MTSAQRSVSGERNSNGRKKTSLINLEYRPCIFRTLKQDGDK